MVDIFDIWSHLKLLSYFLVTKTQENGDFSFFLSKSFLVDVAFIFQAAYMKLFIMIKLTNKCFTGYTNIFYYFIEKKVNFLLVDDCNNIIETCLKTISTKLTKKKKNWGEKAYDFPHLRVNVHLSTSYFYLILLSSLLLNS